MMAEAEVTINCFSRHQLGILFEALKPEVENNSYSRSKVNLRIKEEKLMLSVNAADSVALRATLNTYLRWISVIYDMFSLLDSM